MEEKRIFNRLQLNIPCETNINGSEYQGQIEDISEIGIGFLFYNRLDIELSSRIDFEFYDNTRTEDYHLYGEARVVRIERYDDRTFVGCEILNLKDFYKYIKDKRTEKGFLDSISNETNISNDTIDITIQNDKIWISRNYNAVKEYDFDENIISLIELIREPRLYNVEIHDLRSNIRNYELLTCEIKEGKIST